MKSVCFFLLIICVYAQVPILQSSIGTLTFEAGKFTTYRRAAGPRAQLTCTAGCENPKYLPSAIQCTNRGTDDQGAPQWKCEAQLEPNVEIDSFTVMCEGYNFATDPCVLQGSCGIQYALKITPKAEPTKTIVKETIETVVTKINEPTIVVVDNNERAYRAFVTLIVFIVIIVIVSILLVGCTTETQTVHSTYVRPNTTVYTTTTSPTYVTPPYTQTTIYNTTPVTGYSSPYVPNSITQRVNTTTYRTYEGTQETSHSGSNEKHTSTAYGGTSNI